MSLQRCLGDRLVEQAAFPEEGAWGRMALLLMNRVNGSTSRWLLRRVMKLHGGKEDILDVGCGGGRHMAYMVQRTWGMVCGVDPSSAAVRKASRVNRFGIALGREEVKQGGVEALPYGDGRFDVVTAIESTYFWPSLSLGLIEIQRVLRPGGRVYICNSATERQGSLQLRKDFLVPIHTPLQIEERLREVGFENIDRHRHPHDAQLVCVEAQKREGIE